MYWSSTIHSNMRRPMFLVVCIVLGRVLGNLLYISRQWYIYTHVGANVTTCVSGYASSKGMRSECAFPFVHHYNETSTHLRGEGRSLVESHLGVRRASRYIKDCVFCELKSLTNLTGPTTVSIFVDNLSFFGSVAFNEHHRPWGL